MLWRHVSGGSRVSRSRTCIRRLRLVCPSNIASNVVPKVSLSVALHLHADVFGIGLVCVCKLNALCKYPGKTNVGAGSGTGAGLLTKGRPVIVIPPSKHEGCE